MLPCPCSEDTNKLVWQIGEETVVNHCCVDDHPPHGTYGERTQVFLLNTKGNCSLLLHDVSLIDQETFTCYVFEGKHNVMKRHNVGLKVEEAVSIIHDPSPRNGQPTQQPHTAYVVGVPLSLVLVIPTVLIVVLLIRKRRQRRPIKGVIFGPQALAEMNHTPV
ncbi:uncharacterized protein si:dkey-192g7.3 isoform X2 [Hemibagrus wyckioides]|nr:uncharacterized protein si:dkey-192g7.3 isoform X2 [Hemibagrus wyckioides]